MFLSSQVFRFSVELGEVLVIFYGKIMENRRLLTPVFNKRNIRPRGGKIVLFKYFGLNIIVQR